MTFLHKSFMWCLWRNPISFCYILLWPPFEPELFPSRSLYPLYIDLYFFDINLYKLINFYVSVCLRWVQCCFIQFTSSSPSFFGIYLSSKDIKYTFKIDSSHIFQSLYVTLRIVLTFYTLCFSTSIFFFYLYFQFCFVVFYGTFIIPSFLLNLPVFYCLDLGWYCC